MATWTEDITLALKNLGGIATLSDIYAEVKNVRKGPHPSSIDATIRGAIERNSSDSKAHSGKHDLFFSVSGLGAGIWGLRSAKSSPPIANDFEPLPAGAAEPARQAIVTYRILRETEMARKIKLLHKNRCQLCSLTIQIRGKQYSEAHHLKPLGMPHCGPDIPSNIIVVCPNCHVRLDYFSVHLSAASFQPLGGHVIGSEYIDYPNFRVDLDING